MLFTSRTVRSLSGGSRLRGVNARYSEEESIGFGRI